MMAVFFLEVWSYFQGSGYLLDPDPWIRFTGTRVPNYGSVSYLDIL
jgi:hypothetical protein